MPEVLRPLYESSKVLAQKMTIAVCVSQLNSQDNLCDIHFFFEVGTHKPDSFFLFSPRHYAT